MTDAAWPELIDVTGKMVERFMLTGQPTSMKWMFMTRTYGSKIRYIRTAGGPSDGIKRLCRIRALDLAWARFAYKCMNWSTNAVAL
jgi:hypothetical protein